MPSSNSRNSCRFCGKREDEVAALLAGPPPLFICNECVALASDILIAEEEELFAQSVPAWEPTEDQLRDGAGREVA